MIRWRSTRCFLATRVTFEAQLDSRDVKRDLSLATSGTGPNRGFFRLVAQRNVVSTKTKCTCSTRPRESVWEVSYRSDVVSMSMLRKKCREQEGYSSFSWSPLPATCQNFVFLFLLLQNTIDSNILYDVEVYHDIFT
jgi:hypothetical protein